MFLFTDSNCYEGYNSLKLFSTFEEIKKYILDNINDIDNCIHIFEIDCNNTKFKNEIHIGKEEFLQKYAPIKFEFESIFKCQKLEDDENWKCEKKVKTYSEFGADWEDVRYIYKKKLRSRNEYYFTKNRKRN